jgi:hypothetical protein
MRMLFFFFGELLEPDAGIFGGRNERGYVPCVELIWSRRDRSIFDSIEYYGLCCVSLCM